MEDSGRGVNDMRLLLGGWELNRFVSFFRAVDPEASVEEDALE